MLSPAYNFEKQPPTNPHLVSFLVHQIELPFVASDTAVGASKSQV